MSSIRGLATTRLKPKHNTCTSPLWLWPFYYFLLQDSDEGEEDEEMACQSGSEGTSSEPREDHTDASSVEVNSSRPRRATTLRRTFSVGDTTASQEVPERRRRSTRSLSAYNQNNNKYQPPKGQDMQVQTERRHTDGGSALTVVSNNHVSRLVTWCYQCIDLVIDYKLISRGRRGICERMIMRMGRKRTPA